MSIMAWKKGLKLMARENDGKAIVRYDTPEAEPPGKILCLAG
jgi:hypothetical protein